MKVKQGLLYLVTVVAITYSAYNHLDFAARGIENLDGSVLHAAWPVFFLFISIPVLLLSAFLALVDPVRSARTALVGASLAWGYFVITIPSLFCLVSIVIFIAPEAIFANLIPSLFLTITMIYSSRNGQVFRKASAKL